MGALPRKRLRLGVKTAVMGLVIGTLGQELLDRVQSPLNRLAYGTFAHNFEDGSAFYRLVRDVYSFVMPTYTAAIGVAIVTAPLIIVARMLARGRVRAGNADPLDRLRAFVSARRWLAFVPAVGWMSLLAIWQAVDASYYTTAWRAVVSYIPALVVAFAGFYGLSRVGVHAVTAPTLDKDDANREAMSVRDDEIAFSAVAVTPETKAAVVAVALAPQVVTALVSTLKMSPSLGWLVLAYISVLVAAIAGFSRASRVAVGIDGVHVRGTSRRRFFAYRELGEARLRGSDLELLRGGKVVLRLQLHGADAARAEAVLGRIQGNIARVAERRGRAEERLVETATANQIARAVAGAVNFRQPTLSREALWDIVEGPTVDAEARKAAAKALVTTAEGGERARLRVAATRCADPQLRVALERLDDEGEGAAEEAPRDPWYTAAPRGSS
jgi:hypothetical protein